MKTNHYSGSRSPLSTVGKVFFSLLGILILLCICLLLFAVITEFRPDEVTRLAVTASSGQQTVRTEQSYTLLTFNIGYCGLDASRDTYLEGGAHARAGSLQEVENNLSAVTELLTARTPSFAFLQEVDVNSRRSFGVDQLQPLQELLPNHAASFALGYKAPYVPFPLHAPTGRVESGLLSLSSVAVRESLRIGFDGERSFPQRLFDPRPCFLVTRLTVENGGELTLINARFSAFSGDGAIRALQFAQMKAFLEAEAAEGRYVILGGDWNSRLAEPRSSGHGQAEPDWCAELPGDFAPQGFHWAVDPDIPTRRSGDKPYARGESFTVVSDGFLFSDNIELIDVSALDLDFQHANHNPVLFTFSLKRPA